MKSLVWQQWREHRLYLALLTAWMALAACYCISYEVGYRFRASVGQFSSWALFYTICAAIFLAARAAQGEQAAGTVSFSAALPVSLRRLATARLAGAAATLAMPVLVGAAMLSLAFLFGIVEQAAPRNSVAYQSLLVREAAPLATALEQLGSVTAIAIFGGVELLLILCLLGCWLRTQAQVGLLGAVMGVGAPIASGLLWFGERKPLLQMAYGAVFPQSLAIQWGYGAEQGGFYTDHELAHLRWFALALATPVLALLARLFVTQYGRLPSPRKSKLQWIQAPAIWSRSSAPLPSRSVALVWLELRQSLPLVVFGLLFALLVAAGSVMIEPHDQGSFIDSVRGELPHTMFFVGMLWATVVGSSLYSAELGETLGAFWRSRPISPNRWFWCKFIVGLVAVLAVLDGVTIVLSWSSPRSAMTEGMSWAYIGCFPIIHATMYSLAVAGTCWLRKPVVGGLLAILCYALLTILISSFPTNSLEPISVYNELLAMERAGTIDFAEHGYPAVYGVLAVSTLLFASFASRLARPLEPSLGWPAHRN